MSKRSYESYADWLSTSRRPVSLVDLVEVSDVTADVPQPSKRFVRAALRERNDMIAHRRHLEADRDRLLNGVRDVDDALARLDAGLKVLDQLLGGPAQGNQTRTTSSARAADGLAADDDGGTGKTRHVLSGLTVREVAVQVLLGQPEYIEAIHYRRWYELLGDASYQVAGKDPLAVFLTQLTRSPVIRKSTEPGIYELDRQAPLRLRQLERLNGELQELRLPCSIDPGESGISRARRHELNVTIGQTERALDEALRVLRRDSPPQAPPEAAEPQLGRAEG